MYEIIKTYAHLIKKLQKRTEVFGWILGSFSINRSLNEKKYAQNIWSQDLIHKEPSGYRAVHHGYFLMSCPGQGPFNVLSIVTKVHETVRLHQTTQGLYLQKKTKNRSDICSFIKEN